MSSSRALAQLFLQELAGKTDAWMLACESKKSHLSVWVQRDREQGVHRVKFVGYLHHPIELVDKMLFHQETRKGWDATLETISEHFPDPTNTPSESFIYIAIQCPRGVTNRDFFHARSRFPIESSKSIVVVDRSVQDSQMAPLTKSYVRAHTHFSGGLLEEVMLQDAQTGAMTRGTRYSTITQIDFCGDIPLTIQNFASKKAVARWFKSLVRACDKAPK